jgi:membrane-bound lytic murein transglycosylase D
MKKARAALGTSDIGEIVARYRGPYFGFASRNFYAEFLAALHVMEHSDGYFGQIRPEPLIQFAEVEVPLSSSLPVLAKHLEVSVSDLFMLNPALKEPVLTGASRLPQGYRLRVPSHVPRADRLARLSPQGAGKAPPEAGSGQKAEREPPLLSVGAPAEAVQGESSAKGVGILGGVSAAEASVLAPSGEEPFSFPSPGLPAWRPAGVRFLGNGRPLTGSTRVEPEETLALYAAWLRVPVQRVRQWSRLGPGARLRSGQTVKLVFEKVTPEQFQTARLNYHRGLEETFLKRYKVLRTFPRPLRKGESVWTLSESYKVPYWLLKRYNTDLDSRPHRSGDVIQIPEVEGAAGSGQRPSG